MKSTPRETTQETVNRVIARGEQDRSGGVHGACVAKHYEVKPHGHGVRFAYPDGHVEDFPPHKVGV